MSIADRLVQLRAAAVAVIGFVKRRPRVSIAAAVVLIILGPLLTGSGGGGFLLNLVGLGISALVVWRVARAGKGRQAGCRCNRRNTNTQRYGGTP